ncbi:endonuclease/exonuclease/phosphatase family protein [Bowmanella sp. Y26]|uniref:endonuclease/exonuclease/phosphatase family protein n=1 Tax=Bowmanella yangjiangensis TaxID=2811230 RepID=UPI001BDD4D0C|nr:endonuclease/exonuclease/phosphatase family protein [Bowmanella yangjiangensis]MBT1062320.1 endonuclease/exonuclease/phosphatase family protein [Bowmanella yangjiangensis]
MKNFKFLFLIILFASGCLSISPEFKDGDKDVASILHQPIKVMTFNIRAGRTDNGNVDVIPIIKVIAAVNPDYVMLQEVDVNTLRSGGIDIASKIANATNMNVHFSEAMKYDNGSYGNAVLSKFKVDSHGDITLPEGREPRNAAWIKTGRLTTYSAHFDAWIKAAQVESSETIISIIETSDMPAIFAGDLNALPTSDVVRAFWERFLVVDIKGKDLTFPAVSPNRKIDYIMAFPKDSWKVEEASVLDYPYVSDHRPYLAILRYID